MLSVINVQNEAPRRLLEVLQLPETAKNAERADSDTWGGERENTRPGPFLLGGAHPAVFNLSGHAAIDCRGDNVSHGSANS